MSRAGHRLLPHTADMGIEAWGEDREALFVAAAEGLREMLFGEQVPAADRAVRCRLTANDAAELLVIWLNEILYRFETEELAPSAFVIRDLTAEALDGEIRGTTFDPARHVLEREVKAVTYHQLDLTGNAAGWHARVYVDL